MKFHCDRCKTRYSISDDRVRGKILKIRCKNCSAVITVREESALPSGGSQRPAAKSSSAKSPARKATRSSSPARPSSPSPSSRKTPLPPTGKSGRPSSALRGAFEKAVATDRGPSAADSLSSAPASFEAEWYVANEGDQSGPFDLKEAREWIRARKPGDELFCWSEGFDDWLPVEKVSHFRGLRAGGHRPVAKAPAPAPWVGDIDEKTEIDPSAALLASGASPSAVTEETPKPLFASTMAEVERNAPAGQGLDDLDVLGGNGRSQAPAETPDEDLDLDIGEASRIVSLPVLARQAGASTATGPKGQPALPGTAAAAGGLGRGSGAERAVGDSYGVPAHLLVTAGGGGEPVPAEILQPKRRMNLLMPVIAALCVLAVVVGLLVYIALKPDADDSQVARGTVGGGGELGYIFRDPAARKKQVGAEGNEATPGTRRTTRTGGTRRNGTSGKTTGNNPRVTGKTPLGFDEVDLSNTSGETDVGPLDGDDLMSVYRSNQFTVKRCYERALKKDPLLKVPKVWVSIQVAMTGSVTKVSIPGLAGTDLGQCLQATIGRWKFRRSSEVFNSRFPVVFGS